MWSASKKFSASSVEKSGDLEVIQYGNGLLPLVRLSQQSANDESQLQIVVCRRQEGSVGLVVTKILDIVESRYLDPLSDQSKQITGTALVDGQVTDLLNPDEMVLTPKDQTPRVANWQ